MKQQIHDYLLGLQQRITAAVAQADGGTFITDAWQKPAGEQLGGGGISMLLEDSQLMERAGVGFSHVTGSHMPPSAVANRPELAGRAFEALGVSLVFHPRNPFVPTVHLNVRFFVASKDGEAPVWWFGGGMDLTPIYPFVEDAQHFHQSCFDALAPHGADKYPHYKKWCDDYFYLKHRQETRGVGGIFYDDLSQGSMADGFALMQSVGDSFLGAYMPIVERRRNTPYGERERDFQALRRGRYVEFNLVFDRGTLFGLQSGGRTESILMSMPPIVKWRYNWQAEAGSSEAQLADFLRPRDWLAE